MGYKVDNAIIMAAGMSSRFAPLSYEKPKALISVKGEVLIERQIRQLQEVGIKEIIIVVGYKKEQFRYLEEQYGVILIENPEFSVRNNNSSIYAARNYLKNSYICSADNYFAVNPFETEVGESYYAAVYADGKTEEWCMEYDDMGWITDVSIGGENKWYMLGHVFWSEGFSRRFRVLLENIYNEPDTADKFWENIYMEHIEEFPLKIRKYDSGVIYEFDSLDELRGFDNSYKVDTHSEIIKYCARELNSREEELIDFRPIKDTVGQVCGCFFVNKGILYSYDYKSAELKKGEMIL